MSVVEPRTHLGLYLHASVGVDMSRVMTQWIDLSICVVALRRDVGAANNHALISYERTSAGERNRWKQHC
jgi:hypothetical protein